MSKQNYRWRASKAMGNENKLRLQTGLHVSTILGRHSIRYITYNYLRHYRDLHTNYYYEMTNVTRICNGQVIRSVLAFILGIYQYHLNYHSLSTSLEARTAQGMLRTWVNIPPPSDKNFVVINALVWHPTQYESRHDNVMIAQPPPPHRWQEAR